MFEVETRWTTIKLPKVCRVPGISSALCRILLARGIPPEQMHDFIQAGPALIRPSSELPGVNQAVEQIRRALAREMAITIVGDYDVDGITASVLMYEVLTKLKGKVEIIIPDRRQNGYGISPEIVERIYAASPEARHLIITVDNGANAREAVARALELDMEVVVTDHHTVNTPPDSVVIVNPNHPQYPYTFRGLSGVGVAWKIARSLLEVADLSHVSWEYLDLVALGTIADVSPLIDENRGLVQLGLKQINQNPRPGIRELIKLQLASRFKQAFQPSDTEPADPVDTKISAFDIGMYLAPCLNAAGRIGNPMVAVDLLLSRDEEEAQRLAESLVKLNQERKLLTEQGVASAISLLKAKTPIPKVICLPMPDLEESICGLVAGRIKEKYQRPTLVFTRGLDKEWKGSGRSIQGFDITCLLKAAEDIVKGGGHPQACGFRLDEDNLDYFLETITNFAEKEMEKQQLFRVIRVDLPISPEDITLNLAREIKQLEPFGSGWEEPVVGLLKVPVFGEAMGKEGNHLKLRCRRNGLIFKGWHMFEKYQNLGMPSVLDIVGKIKQNFWNNHETVEVEILDFRT